MMKVAVLYAHPTDPAAFEKYYTSTHLPLARAIKGVEKIELTKFVGAPDGGKPAFYRMAELYFADQAQMTRSLGSPEGVAAVGDFPKFATGGVTVIVGAVNA